MEEIKEHKPGTFSWIDLATTDLEAGKKFYSELFGLKAVDTPMEPGMVYTMLMLNDKPVAALYEISKEQQEQGMRPHWDSYVSVENVEKAVEKARTLNGAVLQEPVDVSDSGRMGIIQDPTGAVLALWEAKKDIGTHFKNIPGSLCWNELITTDTDKAKNFFTELFGWGSHTDEMIDISYTAFLLDEKPVAGMYKMLEEMGDMPSHWLPYFAVEDCDQISSKAQDMGATVLKSPTDIPGTGRFSVLQDPQGAAFAIITMEPME
jgi:predicted enzyme related to lactoylglutathione lyase